MNDDRLIDIFTKLILYTFDIYIQRKNLYILIQKKFETFYLHLTYTFLLSGNTTDNWTQNTTYVVPSFRTNIYKTAIKFEFKTYTY